MRSAGLKEIQEKKRAAKMLLPIWYGWRARVQFKRQLVRTLFAEVGHCVQVRRAFPISRPVHLRAGALLLAYALAARPSRGGMEIAPGFFIPYA